ncbi:hypothetical protein [Trujillonella endophytica]|uniref:Uncharacterized protein n=1 Tax=Trujillonella endophytica TaxID=673521 RepID=A0A1H8SG37_9ACTN|nr:hypothetical protein [Trujillella endophytica]SEO77989.1 hypothetical protein SAMN05660991_01713 [Trujillella endophytica]
MTDPRFGRSAGSLLHRLRPVPVDPADLRDVALEVLPDLATPRLRVVLADDRVDGPVVVVREDERTLRTPLRDLAEDMTAAGVRPTPGALAAALCSWVAHRPVPDASAAADGVAVLDWADGRRVALGWRVVVRRDDVALPWTPAPSTDPAAAARLRAAATARSAAVETELRVEGPVALWSHPAVPLLASAPFAAPERVLDRVAGAGLAMPDMQVVLTPGRPVAGAVAGVAARLAESTGEPCLRLPLRALPTLPWL